MWKSIISLNSFSQQTQFNFFMTVPCEQYLATPLFLFELSGDLLKISDHAVFPFWWICNPWALAANTCLTKFITHRWAWEPVPWKLVVRTFPLQLSRKAQGSNHSNLQAATLQESPPIVVLIYWWKQWNKTLCLKCDLNRPQPLWDCSTPLQS